MRYDEALARLYALRTRGVRMGVSRMTSALKFRRFDTHAMPYIVVAGTNGKGSVSAMLAASLQAAGYRTGLFTSPHLHRFTERIRVDGRAISTSEASRRINDVLHAFSVPRAPEVTFFELSTLMAVEAFRDHDCDVAVLEVGLGGRLDATHALPAVLSVITNIAMDHMEYLGDTLQAVAREKAGIIERGVPVIVGSREPSAVKVIAARARRMQAPMLLIGRDFAPMHAVGSRRLIVQVGSHQLGPFDLALPGDHQHDNAACAVTALELLSRSGATVPAAAVRKGLSRVRWPARLERIAGAPDVLFDAAHNPAGALALAEHLGPVPPPVMRSRKARRVLVFGAMRDKAYRDMIRTLAPCFDEVIFTAAALPRAATAAMLRRAHPGRAAPNVQRALAQARRLAGRSGLVVVAGSIFLVAEARALVLGLPSDPPIRM